MTDTAKPSTNQHYVPQMLLRNFASARKRQHYAHVFDKHKERSFETNIRNIASEHGFYDLQYEGSNADFENLLTNLENKAADAFKKIIDCSSLRLLTEEDKTWISLFIAAQKSRTTNFRAMVKDIDEGVKKWVQNSGEDIKNFKDFTFFENEEQIKDFSIFFLFNSAPEFANYIISKKWLLLISDKSNSFWIGDNPVSMHNDRPLSSRGNIGLAVPGIQIQLPLSPRITLALWCPSILDKLNDGISRANRILQNARASSLLYLPPHIRFATAGVEIARNAIRTFSPVKDAMEHSGNLECDAESPSGKFAK